ncbi:hypothetical protein BC937DRAFT_88772, partial [Endogone sp. FLAS-F59071]
MASSIPTTAPLNPVLNLKARLDAVEAHLAPLLAAPLNETVGRLSIMERCQLELLLAYTVNTTFFIPLAFELVYSLFKEEYPLENDDEGNQYLCLPGTSQRLSSTEVLVEIKRISNIYRNLVNKQEEIDFGSPVVRFAYIYEYVPVHIRMVQKVLEDWNREGGELKTLV